jgi:predicted RNA binding protein YcfA (HicA-like mRNA interferase family)
MTEWPSLKAKRVLSSLMAIGWSIKRQGGSHKILARDGYTDFVFAFHDGEEIGPRVLCQDS